MEKRAQEMYEEIISSFKNLLGDLSYLEDRLSKLPLGTAKLFGMAIQAARKLIQGALNNVEVAEKILERSIRVADQRITAKPSKIKLYPYIKIYSFLVPREGKICSHQEIMEVGWDQKPSHNAFFKAMQRLRAMLASDSQNPYQLITVQSQGYMLTRKPPVPKKQDQ